jgi:hypothetical protein
MFRRRAVVRRGPGLLGVAAIGGVAHAAGRSGASRAAAERAQDEQTAEPNGQQQVMPAAPPPPASPADRIAQLQELAKLRDSGVLTPEEFEREKQRVLA